MFLRFDQNFIKNQHFLGRHFVNFQHFKVGVFIYLFIYLIIFIQDDTVHTSVLQCGPVGKKWIYRPLKPYKITEKHYHEAVTRVNLKFINVKKYISVKIKRT